MMTESQEKMEYLTTLRTQLLESAEGCTGSELGRELYLKGIACGVRAEEWDCENYKSSYPYAGRTASYEKKGYRCFLEAMEFFREAGEEGNDLATLLYAFYLLGYRCDVPEGMRWLERASEAGHAVADYQLYSIYKNGYRDIEAEPARAEHCLARYEARVAEDERQLALACDIEEYADSFRTNLFDWYVARGYRSFLDTPAAKLSAWKYDYDTQAEYEKSRRGFRGFYNRLKGN